MLTIADRTYTSRLILGTGFPTLDLLETAISATGAELVTVALRRVDAVGRTGLVDVLDRAGVDVLPNTAGCFTARDAVAHRQARPRGVRDRLDQARGHRRRAHAAARRARAAARRRGARRRRLHRPALHDRRPGARAAPRGRRLRGGHAARLADRQRAWASATRTTSRSSSSRPACPVVLDAGVGTASDAALAMELGCDAVMARQRDRQGRGPDRDGRARSRSPSRRAAWRAAPGASRAACTPRRRRPPEGLPQFG